MTNLVLQDLKIDFSQDAAKAIIIVGGVALTIYIIYSALGYEFNNLKDWFNNQITQPVKNAVGAVGQAQADQAVDLGNGESIYPGG